MKSQICYCAAEDAHAIVRNRDNTAGAPLPKLVMGLPCELQLRLFANCEDTTPYPLDRFAGIVSWSFEMDTDFSPHSTAKLVARNTDIRLSEVTENGIVYTQITIPIPETRTTELAAALDGKECIILAGELIGRDADREEVFVLQIKGFKAYGRIAGLGETTSVLELVCGTLAEAAVNAVISSGSGITLSGAIIEGQPFSTTVGGYTMIYSSNGLEISNPDAAIGVRINDGGVYLDVVGGSAYIDDISMRFKTIDGSEIAVTESGITANGSAITQATSEFSGTSLGIAELAGGVKYICQSALTALSIGSAAPGCNAAFFFTVASGAVVTLPGDLPFFGEYPNSSGTSYCLAITGDMAVCAAAVSAGV